MFEDMTNEQLEQRLAAIATELDSPEADIDALETEVRNIKDEQKNRKAAEERKAAVRAAVAAGAGKVIESPASAAIEEEKMDINELRASKEYIDAYVSYIKTDKDDEIRALLTQNNVTTGTIPVPTIVQARINAAWERNEVLNRFKKTYLRGNLKVPFEISGEDAVVHTEGDEAIDEEELVIGTVDLIPAMVKKMVNFSDEVMAMNGEDFLDYVYDEMANKIALKEAKLGIADIAAAPAVSDADSVGVPAITEAPGLTTVADAAANLSEAAVNPCIVINRLTEASFVAAMAGGNFAFDAYAGLPRVYCSGLPAYSAASAGQVYMIVGDLNAEQFNYPEGEEIRFKFDDLTLAAEDLVRVIGRKYAAHGVTAPGMVCNVKKPA